MPDDLDADLHPHGPPRLGRLVFGLLIALVLMVSLGVYWIWDRAHRDRRERERGLAAEQTIAPYSLDPAPTTPTNPPPHAP